jgi:hypothetical protein
LLTPLVLGVLGLALLVGAFALYPRRTELPAPPFTQMELTTTAKINLIDYNVDAHPNLTELTIYVFVVPGQPAGPTTLKVSLPFGAHIADCHSPCVLEKVGNLRQYRYASTLAFQPSPDGPVAQVNFFIEAPNFGVTYNGVNASAVLPDIVYEGPDNPQPRLATQYRIPSAASYDWSSLPAFETTSSYAVWTEVLATGETPAREAVGTDHAADTNDNTMTFVAGALLGLAGGAILSAIQEALHAKD